MGCTPPSKQSASASQNLKGKKSSQQNITRQNNSDP